MPPFNKLQKVINVDKPVFQLADPNNPATYRLNQQPVSTAQAPQLEQPEEPQMPQKQFNQLQSGMTSLLAPRSPTQSRIDNIPDDKKAATESVQEILGMDADDALDELGKVKDYDMTEKDKGLVRNKVLEMMRRTGRISDDENEI